MNHYQAIVVRNAIVIRRLRSIIFVITGRRSGKKQALKGFDSAKIWIQGICYIVKPVGKDHLRDPKILVVIDKCSLSRGSFMLLDVKNGTSIVGNRYRQVDKQRL
jgi:hypothetical protein